RAPLRRQEDGHSIASWKAAGIRHLVAVASEHPVRLVKALAKEGQTRQDRKRVRPSDSLHGVAVHVGARHQFAARQQKPDVLKQLLIGELNLLFHPSALKGRDLKSSSEESRLPQGNPPAAEST